MAAKITVIARTASASQVNHHPMTSCTVFAAGSVRVGRERAGSTAARAAGAGAAGTGALGASIATVAATVRGGADAVAGDDITWVGATTRSWAGAE
jgi:hypothetical protein